MAWPWNTNINKTAKHMLTGKPRQKIISTFCNSGEYIVEFMQEYQSNIVFNALTFARSLLRI